MTPLKITMKGERGKHVFFSDGSRSHIVITAPSRQSIDTAIGRGYATTSSSSPQSESARHCVFPPFCVWVGEQLDIVRSPTFPVPAFPDPLAIIFVMQLKLEESEKEGEPRQNLYATA